MKVRLSKRASADLERLFRFLDAESPTAASRLLTAFREAQRSLEELPLRGRPVSPVGTRELHLPFGQSTYLLRYRVNEDAGPVTILRIWHGREQRG